MPQWKWTCKYRHNRVLEPIDEWYAIKHFADYARAYSIKLQYALDENGKETSDVEYYIAIEYEHCQKATDEDKRQHWWRTSCYDNYLFEMPGLIRVCKTMQEAKKVIYERHKYVSDIVNQYLPLKTMPEKDEKILNLTAI